MIACKSNDWVTEESAITVRINGTTVFIICQSAIRSSLAICDFRSKSTLRTGRERGMRVAELFNWPRHFGFVTETGLVWSYRNLLSRVESFGLANTAAWTYRASSGQNPVRNLTTFLETELRKRVVAKNQLRVTQAQKAFSSAPEWFRPDNRGSRGPEAQIRPCCDGIGKSVLKALSVISIGASALVLRQLAVLAAENEGEQRELGEIRTQEGKTEQDEAKGLEPVEQLGLATCQ